METREYSLRANVVGIEKREADGSVWAVGYAVKYNQLSRQIGWGFREKFLPGAFDECLLHDPNTDIDYDTICAYNHRALLGRRSAKTLELSSDEIGLKYRVLLADTTTGRDVRIGIERGDIRYCSFSFRVAAQGDGWEEDAANGTVRSISKVKYLFDVAPVDDPAYAQTEISIEAAQRSYDTYKKIEPNTFEAEARERKLKLLNL
jgi:uncharacterized protein